MGWWGDRVVPRLVDRALSTDDVRPAREQACTGLAGRVLEIGFGSGLNVAHYPAGVEEVLAVEPSDLAWRLAAPRIAAGAVPVRRSGLDGQRLLQDDDSVDAVLSTFTLCTIPDVQAALAEVRRVLRPGGSLHFAEHGRAPDERVARWQDRVQPVYGRLAGGCHVTRSVTGELERAGLAPRDVRSGYLPGPGPSRPFGYLSTGRAQVA
ncbi:MAG: SAM-dependent methyltransferase [Marmoricola sp.]|nr:SAM-dependent methyltransferase [Marmoricola sp.]